MNTAEVRRHVEEVLASPPEEDEDIVPGSLCVAWVLVSDWMAPDGTRVLRVDDTEDLPIWTRDGMLEWAQTVGTDD